MKTQLFNVSLLLGLCLTVLAGCDDVAPTVAVPEPDASTPTPSLPPSTDGALPADPAVGPPNPCDASPCRFGEECVVDTADDGTMESRCLPPELPNSPCADTACAPHERCVVEDDVATCAADCASDLACPRGAFCGADGACQPAQCPSGETRCDGDTVQRCADNGSAFERYLECDSADLGEPSVCVEVRSGEATCSCRDAWHCPANMRCEAGHCQGAPEGAACILPPTNFQDALPSPELIWGGTFDDPALADGPLPQSSQVVMTPIVANLNDDNGDGRIDERDNAEIIFTSFCRSQFQEHGTLRAITAAGAAGGLDLFAVQGDRVWRRGDALEDFADVRCRDGQINPTGGLAVGDLDDPTTSDGRPEIVAIQQPRGIMVYDNTGAVLLDADRQYRRNPTSGATPTPSIANVDGVGLAEVIVGHQVSQFARDERGQLIRTAVFDLRDAEYAAHGNLEGEVALGPISCVADILGDSALEIVAGGGVYGLPRAPAGATRPEDCAENGGVITPTTPEEEDFCASRLTVHWLAHVVNDSIRRPLNGFCAIGDILGGDHGVRPGPDNPLDGRPEVIIVANGAVRVFDGETGREAQVSRDLPPVASGTEGGGAPTLDDFDGDGFPEVGIAFATAYKVLDLQAPTALCPAWNEVQEDALRPVENQPRRPGGLGETGACQVNADCADGAVCNQTTQRCVCLHNGWSQATEDGSSRGTGSTVFDFNGDGSAEVVYNDECWFRIYDGHDGRVLVKEPSESRTRIENPVVADVDNDGKAEIVFGASNESGYCSERRDHREAYNNGVEVWGADNWVPARRIWNQHAYQVTQVYEDGGIPLSAPRPGRTINGRRYNTYRAQPRTPGRAPDLTLTDVHVANRDSLCGALTGSTRISAVVHNAGGLRVGDDVRVAIEGRWNDGAFAPLHAPDGTPLERRLGATLGAGASLRVDFEYDPEADPMLTARPPRLPSEIRVTVDAEDLVSECREDNNQATIVMTGTEGAGDLDVVSVHVLSHGMCNGAMGQGAAFEATIANVGGAPIAGAVAAFYAGDPDAGGRLLVEIPLEGTLAMNAQTTVRAHGVFLGTQNAVDIYVVVDPHSQITECDERNNAGRAAGPVQCQNG